MILHIMKNILTYTLIYILIKHIHIKKTNSTLGSKKIFNNNVLSHTKTISLKSILKKKSNDFYTKFL